MIELNVEQVFFKNHVQMHDKKKNKKNPHPTCPLELRVRTRINTCTTLLLHICHTMALQTQNCSIKVQLYDNKEQKEPLPVPWNGELGHKQVYVRHYY